VLGATLAIVAFDARAQTSTSTFYGVSKELQYTQSSSAAPVLATPTPALFGVSMPGGVAGSFRTPAGVTTAVRAGDEFQQRFATRAAMDAAFPDGTYTLTVGNTANIPLALQSSTYPSEPPQVLGGTWTQGRLVIDPTRDATIQFNATAGWGTTGVFSFAYFSLWEGEGDDIISITRASTEAAGPITTVTIPARTLVAGHTYNVEVFRFHAAVIDRTSIPGSFGFTGNANQTTFQVSAVAPANAAPTIVTQPTSVGVVAGGTAVFSVNATGTPAPSYQWRKDGVAITGATASSLMLSNVTAANTGSYTVVITNSAGSTTSSAAALTLVSAGAVGRLINLSILTAIGSGGDSFTMGYVVGGAGTSGPKPLVIRAAGPSLAALGVGGPLDDPRLELFAGSAKTGENDNWGGGAELTSAMASVGAFAFSGASSRDAAALANIISSDNSVRVSATGNGSGMVIAELYDATPVASYSATTPRLINVSVLKSVGTGLTAGFVIGGSMAKTVLVRAIGPTLGAAPFNVPGVIADPQIALYSGQTKLNENNDWGGGAALSAAFTQVGAFALPATSKDAALLATLAPGNYTVQVNGTPSAGSGQAGPTGTALIEIYEVP
jgi:hypothetical protein